MYLLINISKRERERERERIVIYENKINKEGYKTLKKEMRRIKCKKICKIRNY